MNNPSLRAINQFANLHDQKVVKESLVNCINARDFEKNEKCLQAAFLS